MPSPAPFFVAVHVGAGFHSERKNPAYKAVMRRACKRAADVLMAGGSAEQAVVQAIMALEDSPVCNAGIGSNLTEVGCVECDASIMAGDGVFGSVGAAPGVAHPIEAAACLASESREPMPLGRVRPIFLVGDGARQYALSRGLLAALSAEEARHWNIAPDALIAWQRYRVLVEQAAINRSVGCVLPFKAPKSGAKSGASQPQRKGSAPPAPKRSRRASQQLPDTTSKNAHDRTSDYGYALMDVGGGQMDGGADGRFLTAPQTLKDAAANGAPPVEMIGLMRGEALGPAAQPSGLHKGAGGELPPWMAGVSRMPPAEHPRGAVAPAPALERPPYFEAAPYGVAESPPWYAYPGRVPHEWWEDARDAGAPPWPSPPSAVEPAPGGYPIFGYPSIPAPPPVDFNMPDPHGMWKLRMGFHPSMPGIGQVPLVPQMPSVPSAFPATFPRAPEFNPNMPPSQQGMGKPGRLMPPHDQPWWRYNHRDMSPVTQRFGMMDGANDSPMVGPPYKPPVPDYAMMGLDPYGNALPPIPPFGFGAIPAYPPWPPGINLYAMGPAPMWAPPPPQQPPITVTGGDEDGEVVESQQREHPPACVEDNNKTTRAAPAYDDAAKPAPPSSPRPLLTHTQAPAFMSHHTAAAIASHGDNEVATDGAADVDDGPGPSEPDAVLRHFYRKQFPWQPQVPMQMGHPGAPGQWWQPNLHPSSPAIYHASLHANHAGHVPGYLPGSSAAPAPPNPPPRVGSSHMQEAQRDALSSPALIYGTSQSQPPASVPHELLGLSSSAAAPGRGGVAGALTRSQITAHEQLAAHQAAIAKHYAALLPPQKIWQLRQEHDRQQKMLAQEHHDINRANNKHPGGGASPAPSESDSAEVRRCKEEDAMGGALMREPGLACGLPAEQDEGGQGCEEDAAIDAACGDTAAAEGAAGEGGCALKRSGAPKDIRRLSSHGLGRFSSMRTKPSAPPPPSHAESEKMYHEWEQLLRNPAARYPAVSVHDGVTSDEVFDTVGAVCVDVNGNVAAGVSSGGIAMKMDGRVGDSAVFGCGVWACNPDEKGKPGVACTTTGVGENIIRTLLAKSCADAIQDMADDAPMDLAISRQIQAGVKTCPPPHDVGVLAVMVDKRDGQVAVQMTVVHTAASMGVAYYQHDGSDSKEGHQLGIKMLRQINRMPHGSADGDTGICVFGTNVAWDCS